MAALGQFKGSLGFSTGSLFCWKHSSLPFSYFKTRIRDKAAGRWGLHKLSFPYGKRPFLLCPQQYPSTTCATWNTQQGYQMNNRINERTEKKWQNWVLRNMFDNNSISGNKSLPKQISNIHGKKIKKLKNIYIHGSFWKHYSKEWKIRKKPKLLLEPGWQIVQ